MPCLWRKTASFPAKPVERRYHSTISPHLPSPTAPSLEAVRDARNKREWDSRTSEREGWCWCLACEVRGLSPRREHLSKGLKPVEEWAVCRWKRRVFQGNHRGKGNVLCLSGHGDFKEQPGVPCGPAPERRSGGEVHFHKHSRSSHKLPPPPGKKVSLLRNHLNLPSSKRLSGPPESWGEWVDTPLPCGGGYFLYYQQRMSFSKRDFVLYH